MLEIFNAYVEGSLALRNHLHSICKGRVFSVFEDGGFLEGEGWELLRKRVIWYSLYAPTGDIRDWGLHLGDICKWAEQEEISRFAIATLLWCVSNDYLRLDPEFRQGGSERFLNYGLEIARVNYKWKMFGAWSIEIRYSVRRIPNMLLVEYDGKERIVFNKTILPWML